MILVIDNYDSFTYNLVDYIGKINVGEVAVYRNDEISCDEIAALSPTHIVVSPGPKRPEHAGISMDLIKRFSGVIPILGVCLGHQAICEVFGGKTIHAKRLMHGKVSGVTHTGHDLFKSMPSPFDATRYHSLVTDRMVLPECLNIIAESADDNEIMAVAHSKHATYGVQFHPESICTPDGLQLIKNFFNLSA